MFALSKDVEITVEANPESVLRPGLLSELLTMGVSRISLGVQSFQEKILRILGASPYCSGCGDAVTAVHEPDLPMSARFDMGLPDQTEELWLEDLDRAATLGPTHLSCYGLSLEAGTALNARICGGK
jgi:oxygen-independent coproporphyrinogen-3 oxidase